MALPSESVGVPLAALADLAVECWRLERVLRTQANSDSSTALRYSVRRLRKFIQEAGLATVDPEAQRYDTGLAVDVIGVQGGGTAVSTDAIIVETVSPIVTWRGQVILHGQVVLAPEAPASKKEE